MASTIKLNYNHKALGSVINYNRKPDATIQSVNLTSSFTIVIRLYNRPRVKKMKTKKLLIKRLFFKV